MQKIKEGLLETFLLKRKKKNQTCFLQTNLVVYPPQNLASSFFSQTKPIFSIISLYYDSFTSQDFTFFLLILWQSCIKRSHSYGNHASTPTPPTSFTKRDFPQSNRMAVVYPPTSPMSYIKKVLPNLQNSQCFLFQSLCHESKVRSTSSKNSMAVVSIQESPISSKTLKISMPST